MTPPASPDRFATSIEINSADLGGNGSGDFFPQTLAFEPNGNRTAFISVNPQDVIAAPGITIHISPQSLKLFDPAEGVRELVSNADENIVLGQVIWTPDSRRLIFSRQDPSQGADLFIYDLSEDRAFSLGERSSPITTLPRLDGFSPALRSDGGVIAFVRRNKVDGKDQIFTCNLDLTRNQCEGVTALTTQGSNSLPSWTPDGQFILFASDRDGNREIYQMKADGSEQVRLTQDNADDLGPAVHPVSFQIPAN
jgi:Tol biopolymer transport system component